MGTRGRQTRTDKRPKAGQAWHFLGSGQRRRLSLLLRRKPALAAVAYVSDAEGLPLGKGDLLVCDASDATARAGSTRREALDALLGNEVEIWSCPRLHAKVVVTGGRVLVGSANWSARSATKLIEAGIEVADARVVAKAEAFVRALARPPSIRVTRAFLKRMPEPEAQLPSGSGGRRQDDGPPRHWLIRLRPLILRGAAKQMSEKLELDQERLSRSGVGGRDMETLVWSGPKGPGPKMRPGDTVRVIWREPGEVALVYPSAPIVWVRRETTTTGVIYIHRSQHKARRLSFGIFAALAKKSGLTRVSENSSRELTTAHEEALTKLWPKSPRRR